MAKYSYEFKKQMVSEYLNGKGGYRSIAEKHGMRDTKRLREWVANYKKFGDDGLKRSRDNRTYTFKEKLSIVESYLTSELSYQELALQSGINNSSIITRLKQEI